MSKKPAPFNNPFTRLKLPTEDKKKKAPARAPEPAKAPPAPEPPPPDDEGALFRAAVGEVEPVRPGPKKLEPHPPPLDEVRLRTEDDEVLEHLASLVGGGGPFDLADSDEFIEGMIVGLDRRIVRRLRKGEYAVQGHIDLHGMVKVEAKQALETFVLAARRAGKRCVLVVHGRGLHSKDQLPVLKESVQVWLSKGRIAKEVLAFATARPCDGGAGAVYVLLRR